LLYDAVSREICWQFFYNGDEPKFVFARDLDDGLQSQNASFGTSGELFMGGTLFCKMKSGQLVAGDRK